MLMILNTAEEVEAILTNDMPDACPYFDDVHTEGLDGTLTYDFACPADHTSADYVQPENLVLFNDLHGAYKLCRIKEVAESLEPDGTRLKRVRCEGLAYELAGEVLRPVSYTGQTATQILDDLLDGTRWVPGDVDYTGTMDFTYKDYQSVFTAVRALQEECGLEMVYRTTFNTARRQVTGHYIDLVSRVGSDTMRFIEYARDAKSITRTGDSSRLVTALIGLGKSKPDGTYVTFTAEDETYKPAGQDYVGDDDARELYGVPQSDGSRTHIYGVYRVDDESSAAKLLVKTRAELARRVVPDYTYDVDAAMLDRLPSQKPGDVWNEYSHEFIGLGDQVVVRDLTFSPPLMVTVRVQEITRSYTDPGGRGLKVARPMGRWSGR